MINNFKIVQYEKFCKKCKNYKTNSNINPCDECLSEFVNTDSIKPLNFEYNDKIKEKNEKEV